MKYARDDTGKYALKDSLCWHCSRATDSTCSWSSCLTPVDGWEAEYNGKRKSYTVRRCPLFAQYDKDKGYEMDDVGAEKLSDAVMARAGRDYLDLMEHEMEICESDIALGTKRALYGNWYRRNKEPMKWGRFTSNTWVTLYDYEVFNNEIIALERFFASEDAEIFGTNINPIYVMESIKRKVGLRCEIL